MPDDTPIQFRTYTLNGEPVDLGLVCPILSDDQMLAVGDLEPGQEIDVGGEGCLPYLLRRTA